MANIYDIEDELHGLIEEADRMGIPAAVPPSKCTVEFISLVLRSPNFPDKVCIPRHNASLLPMLRKSTRDKVKKPEFRVNGERITSNATARSVGTSRRIASQLIEPY